MKTMQLRAYDLSQLSVLVIDDCQFMRLLLDRMLKAIGVGRVETANDGQSGLDLVAGHGLYETVRPDIIITDWEMEPMNGATLVKLIREADNPNISEIPMIMLTGHTDLDRVKNARDLGISEFLAKPVSAQMLYQRMIRIIDNPRPFVRSLDFSGPCRRRVNKNFTGNDRRKMDLLGQRAL